MSNKMDFAEKISRWKELPCRVLTLAGRRKTGKTEAINYLLSNYAGISHFRIADGVNAVAQALRIQPSRRVQHALFDLNIVLYPVLGESAFKRLTAVLMDESRPPLAFVEAVRTFEEEEEFVVKRGGLIIGLTADDKVRYARLMKDLDIGEKKDEAALSFEEFMGDPEKGTGEYHKIEREIPPIVARAHFRIENNSENPEDLHREIDTIMGILGIKKK